ncbi:HYR domain-containing protein [Flavobacterium sp. N1736]|uniref:HYR domain-containing protein n=1 Tax=Flavobacterium sp. N1736 TaxID=2986823 RepID=UPI002224AE62|nr:HYR domain-containing protein [Flavobacterium sp. N1736]
MRNFTLSKFNSFKLVFFILLLLSTTQTRAQFPYSQSFKNSTAPGVLFGGSPVAFLTAGAGAKDGYTDLEGSGYLRLTNSQGSQKGIVYSDMYSFPSAYGMTITFEYYTHGGNGADGIAFILFDATASPVATGAFGGSLGYAQRNTETGFSKGYLGIGIDEYGNYSANNEGKSGGVAVLPSNITLRGAGTGTTGYAYLTSVQTTALATPFNVAGNDRTATDNTKAGFRKMEVVLKPRSGGGFFINVYLTHGSVRDLIINNYAYTTTAPSNLKFAISSSTGGSNNFHEIRNLNITVDQSTLLTPVANADSLIGCVGLPATSGDITANDNGTVNTLGTINKSTVDLDTATAGIQTSNTVAGKGTFTYDSSTGNVTFTPLNNTVVGPVAINYTFNDTYNKTSNSSTITYNTYTPIANNTITAPSPSSFCTSPNDPGNIVGSTATGGTTTLTYQWYSSLDNVTFNPISGATGLSYDPPSTSTTAYYRREVTSATCKNTSNVVSIIFGTASTPTATAATAVTCNSFTANWNAVPNASSYGLSVSTNSGFTSHVGNFDGRDLTSATSYNVTGLTSGQTYYFKVWSFNSCGVGATSSNVISVIVGNGSVAGTVSSAQTICSGSSPADLTLNGYTGTIQWQSSTDNSSFNNILSATGSTLTSAQMGTLSANKYYRAVVTSGSCTPANTASVLITISPVPTLATAAQSATVCVGSTARINLTGLLANSTSTIVYSIDGVSQTPVTGVIANASGASGFDSAVLTAANDGKILKITGITTTSTTPNCTSAVDKDVVLSVNATSIGGTIAAVPAICAGTSPANLVLSGNTGTVVKWQKSTDSGFTSPVDIAGNSTTLTGATIGNLNTSTYFRAIVQNGVCSAAFSSSVLVTVNALPTILSLTGNTICVSPGGNGTITSSTSETGISYQLYNSGNTAVQTAKSGTGSALSWTGLAAGNGYYVIATNTSTTCTSTSGTVNITTTPNPVALTLTGSSICVSPGGNGTITSSTSATGINYQLYNSGNTAVQTAKSGTGSALSWTGLAAGNGYYVIATNTSTTCTSTSSTVNITTTPNPVVLILTGSSICVSPGGNGTITSSTSETGISYQLFNSGNTAVQTAKSGTGSALSWTGLAAGNGYYVVATNTSTTCSSTSGTVNIVTTPNPVALALTGSMICVSPGANGTITSTASVTGINYQLYNSGNTAVQTAKSGTGSALSWTGLVAGNGYYVTGTNASTTCSSVSNIVDVVNDTQKPTITCPSNVTAVADANSCVATGVNLGTPTISDNCSGTVTTINNAPSSFPIGVTTVTWTATDGMGNTQTCTQTVTVNDTQKPTITCPSNVTAVADTNSCTATGVILGTPATTDNCTGTITVTNDAPSSFPIGVTTVIWTAKDTAGNTQTCTQTVTVNDTQKPTITCPANVTAVADTNSCTATGIVLGTPATTDNCTGTITVTNDAPSSFPIGVTTVTWTAKDTAGNTQTCSQTVTINDTQKPTITCPSNVTTVADTNSCTATGVVLGTPTTTDNCTGTITVTNDAPSSFPIGVTTVTWTAKDTAGNTQTCSQTVKVVGPIKANDDIVLSLNGYTGGTTVSNVLSNDLLNCNNVIASDINLTLTSTLPSVLNFNATTGSVTVNPQTPAGTYSFDYTICEKSNSTNCSTASVKITVVVPTINAVTETTTSINGNTGGTTISLTANDTLNGNPVVIGTNLGEVKLTGITVPTGLTLNPNGTITVAANTPAGNYNVEYSICEITNPTNCDTVISVIVVGKPTIDAVTETATSINGNTGGTTTESLITNDTLNGNPIVIGTNPGEVKLTGITVPTGLTLNANGTITVAANTPAGNYNVEYSICEITNPTNCDTVISVVTVGKPTIDAVTETTTEVNGNTGGTTTSLTANDTLNGNPVVIGTNPGEVKLTGIIVQAGLTLNANGTITVAANTPAGNYNVEYSICEITNPTNCDTVISVVTVGKPTIDAVTETTTEVNGNIGGTTTESLITNDTLNGTPVVIGTNPGEVKLTGITVPTGLTLNANGTVTVAANTPTANYNVEYSICEITNPTNCDTVISVIVVGTPTIDAVTETTTEVNGITGGTTISLTANDTLNGTPVVIGTNPGEVKLTGITVPTGLTLNANGTVTVAANTPAANYNVEYSICEITNPTNCDTVISVIVVGKPTIDAVTETTTEVNGNIGGTTTSLTANDTLNGNPVVIGTNPGEVKLTGITVPTGLTLNANGTVTIAANTPAGNYNVEYSICEITNPTNCDTVISVIVAGKPTIDAVTETTTEVNGNTGGTTTESLITNDTLNGTPVVIGTNPGEVKLTGITVPTGLTLNANGTVTIAANTPAGNYNIEYSICEITNPTNCDTVISVIVVGKPTIDAVTETTTEVNGNTGGTTTSLTANDTLNGSPVVIGTNQGEVKLTGITVPTGLTLNANGTVTIVANTPAGNYNVEYSICEITNPTNCDTVISVVTVGKPTIDAVTETTTEVNGNTGGTTISLTANDTLNGTPVVIGTNPGEVKLTGITVPTGLTLNANGTVTIVANTPAGNYNVEYSICEITNPTNCDVVISIIPVTGGLLQANPDVIPSVVTTNLQQTIVNVFDNDTNNGIAVVPNDVNLSIVTPDPTGILTLNPDGTVTVGANAPAGNYELTYQICEKLNPTNCSSATIKVTVNAPVINAVEDTTTTIINGVVGGKTEPLVANDTLNGLPVVIGTNPGDVKLTGVTLPTGFILNADGTVTVPANTPTGNYNVEYKICEINNPTNCDSATSIIVVNGGVLIANPDVIPSVVATNLPQTIVNVFDNDTNNGLPVIANDMNLTQTVADPTGILTLNPDGTVTVGANAPAGNYELTYQICEKLNPTNCSSATIKVTVNAPVINAVEDTTTTIINGVVGGKTESLVANDTLNGNPVVIGTNPGDVKLTGVTVPTGFILNADGTVTVPANTPAGNYNVEYKICEINNPTNCDSATSIIVVNGGVLIANPDVIPSVVATNQPQTVVNVFDNDTNNGIAVVPNDVNLSIVTADPTGILTLNPDGTVTVGANAPAGNYEIVYQICEKVNTTNCSSASIKVEVKAGIINAVEDTTTTIINGVVGGKTESLVANDTLNGLPVVIGTNPGDVNLTGVTLPTGFILNADGTVTVPANTPAGNYNVEYKICEINNPTNCDSATSIIVVNGGVLIANPDVIPSVIATNQPQTVVNVFDNDTNNGIAVVPNDVNLSIVTADPTGILTLNPDGTVAIGANAPAGNYEIVYQICEKLNPTNCSSATIKVIVNAPVINAVEDTTTTIINGVVGGKTESLVTNDTLNGLPVVIGTNLGDVKLSGITVPTGFILNADGTVTVPANTPAGNYNVEYKICEINNPTNCDSATSIIVVTNGDLHANPDLIPSVVEGKQTQVLLNVFDNDTNSGLPVVPNDLNLTIVTADPTGFLTVNTDGTVRLGANAPAGTYELTYQICEKLNATNCSQAIVRVKVNAVIPITPMQPIFASNDTDVLVDGINGQLEFINVLANDLLNGLPVSASDVIISNTPNPYFEFNSDGTVNVLPNTPGGSYTLAYQICEKANASNCSTATLNVFVEVPAIAIIKTATFNDENRDGYANAGETIAYKFKITNTGNVPLVKIMVTDLLPGIVVSGQEIDLAVNESDENSITAQYKITQTDINLGSVSNQATVKGRSERGVVVEDKSDNTNNTEDKPTVLPLNGCQIEVLNAFSPNGDSKNERFYIRGLECYPDNTVEIYNRWGVLVFDIDHYNNEDRAFVGYSAGRATIKQSDGLPVGTYFYILKYRDSESNQHEKSGYLYINK